MEKKKNSKKTKLTSPKTAEISTGTPAPDTSLESFVPTDLYQEEVRKKEKRKKQLLIIVAAVFTFLAIVLIYLFSYYKKLKNTSDMFQSTPVPEETATVAETVAEAAAEIAPTPDPFAEYDAAKAADSVPVVSDNILNVCLMGIDYSEERESWKGKDGLSAAHADVIIVLAINFDKNTATMISLPRDTYTHVPGVSGIYKLNASLNCGGGLLAENGTGFEKVCDTASYLLGGIPVDYYFAVTMPAVKDLVDAIGGVDYKLDVSFTMQHRSYSSGRQHMDGQAVLDYLRVRKELSGLDANQAGDVQRVKRQKKMLIAIFNQLKSKDMLLNIPDILEAFEGQLYTNCTKDQIASLALYGVGMDSDNISMRSMSGSGGSLYGWNFSFIKQDERVELIEDVYGVTVPKLDELSKNSARKEYVTRIANKYVNTAHAVLDYAKEQIDAGNADASQKSLYERLNTAILNCIEARTGSSNGRISSTGSIVKRIAKICASSFGYPEELDWTVPDLVDVNEVYVDFR